MTAAPAPATAVTAPGTPSGYAVTVPAAWDRVPLDDGARERAVRRIVARGFAGRDDRPLLRAAVERELLSAAAEAASRGGLELHLAARPVAGVVVPASLLVHVLPPEAVGAPGAAGLAAALTTGADPAAVTVVELPAGPAVRRRRTLPAVAGEDGARPGSVVVDHFVPLPGAAAGPPTVLVLTGSTPRVPWEEGVVVLLDAVARTLRWT
ncbi:hypothetical protein [Kineococcus arenarius]|uniref:hypothetical protein n=1 Tax=Kineococcus sp. SYSU DK007 TaxID=3383128 RepID=UPI003D7DEB59